MQQVNQQAERSIFTKGNPTIEGAQNKQYNEDYEQHQSPLETKNTTTFSFQDQSAFINKSANEHLINDDKITAPFQVQSPPKDGLLNIQSRQSFNSFHLKLKPLVLTINKRQSIKDCNSQAADRIASPQKFTSALSKKNSIIMSQEYIPQQSLVFSRNLSQPDIGEYLEEASSPTKQRLNYLIQKNTIDFNSEEDINWILRIAKKTHKTKMELAYFRKFAYYYPVIEQQLKNVDKDNISQEIFNQFRLTTYGANRIVQKCDETFYIVLKGSLTLLEKNNILDVSIEENYLQNNFPNDEDEMKIWSDEKILSSTEIFSNQENYTTIKRYFPGDGFGQISLFEQSEVQGIVVTETECQLIEITKERIQSILAKHQASEIQEQIDFFKSFSFFKDIPMYALMAFIKSIKLKELIRGDVLYSEKDTIDNIYFVKNGEVEISKLIDSEVSQDPTPSNNPNNQQLMIPLLNIQNINQSQNTSPLLRRKSKGGELIPLKFTQHSKKRISLKILTSSSYFGQEEILQKASKRENKAVVLSPSAQIYILNQIECMNFLQKHSQLQRLVDENSLKEMAEEQRKKLIKNVQVKIQNRQKYESQLYYQASYQCKTSENTPKSSNELKSPISRQQSSIMSLKKANTHRGYSQQFSSAIFDNSNNKSIATFNSRTHLQIPLQCQKPDETENISTDQQYIMQNIKTLPSSNRGSPRLYKLESHTQLVSPYKRDTSATKSAHRQQQFFSDYFENQNTSHLTEKPLNVQNNASQENTEYCLSPIIQKQIPRNLISPRIIKLQSGQRGEGNGDILKTTSSRTASQNQGQFSANKTINSFRAYDQDPSKRGNLFDQNGYPILMVQFKTENDTSTSARKSLSKRQTNENQLFNKEERVQKTLNLKAIFKSPPVKTKRDNQQKIAPLTTQFNEQTEQQQQQTIRSNEIVDKNQKVYYDLSPLKKQILSSLIQTNKQNNPNQNNHYIKSVSPLRQLPTHPEILSNIPKKFWKDNQKILEQNEQKVKLGSSLNKREYQRAGRKYNVQGSSLIERNMDKIMQIARQQTQVSPRHAQGQEEEFVQMNIGRINVQNLEWQLKNNQQK